MRRFSDGGVAAVFKAYPPAVRASLMALRELVFETGRFMGQAVSSLVGTLNVHRIVIAGEMARFVPELPLKLVIIDESIVMFGMEDPVAGSSELTIMVVDHPSLAGVLKIAFNAVWEQGLTFDEAYEELVLRRRRTA